MFPYYSALYSNRTIYSITATATRYIHVKVNPWNLRQPSAASTVQTAYINIDFSNGYAAGWDLAYQHPLYGQGGDSSSATGKYCSFRQVATNVMVQFSGQLLDYAGKVTACLTPGPGTYNNIAKPTAS
jgi:hypothetical protein